MAARKLLENEQHHPGSRPAWAWGREEPSPNFSIFANGRFEGMLEYFII